jgi:hypothetical protein
MAEYSIENLVEVGGWWATKTRFLDLLWSVFSVSNEFSTEVFSLPAPPKLPLKKLPPKRR